MKPNTDSMQKPQFEASVEVKDYHSSPRRKKTAVIASGIVAILLVISIVVGVVTYVELKTAGDKGVVVEGNFKFYLQQLNETIEEKVVVTDDEEDITTPSLRVIFDYRSGFVVTHFEKDGNGQDAEICFVREFIPRGNTSMIKAGVKEEEKDVVVTNETKTEQYVSTGVPFDRKLLSEKAAAMCANSRVVFMRKSIEAGPGNTEGNSATRKKRQEDCYYYYYDSVCYLSGVQEETERCYYGRCVHVVTVETYTSCYAEEYCYYYV